MTNLRIIKGRDEALNESATDAQVIALLDATWSEIAYDALAGSGGRMDLDDVTSLLCTQLEGPDVGSRDLPAARTFLALPSARQRALVAKARLEGVHESEVSEGNRTRP